MEKGFWLKFFLIVLVIFVVVLITFAVDFNLIATENAPKFCVSVIEHDDTATEYIGILYKIIKYNLDDENFKYKIGTWFLTYDSNFIEQFSDKIHIQGYIKNINNQNGICVVYIEDSKYFAKRYEYDKAYVVVSSDTEIKEYDTNKLLNKSDIKIGQLVSVSFAGNVQEIYPVRGTAKTFYIIKNVENGEDIDE